MTVKELLNGLTEEQRDNIVAALYLDAGMDFTELESYAVELNKSVREMFLPRLRLHCGQFDTLFDNVSDFYYYHLSWLRLHLPIWGRYFRTVVVKYNVIHNTDRTQEETVTSTNSGEGNSVTSGNSSSNANITHTANNSDTETVNGNTTKTGNNSALHQISAANQADFHNKYKDVTDNTENGTASEERSGSHKHNENDTSSGNSSSEQEQTYNTESTSKVVHKIRAYGNIGVTTNQEMLAQEREHLAFDMLDKMLRDFKKEFCIMVY